MEKWFAEKVVASWDQRKDVENHEKDDGMYEKCCGAGRGKNEDVLIFYKEQHRDTVICML